MLITLYFLTLVNQKKRKYKTEKNAISKHVDYIIKLLSFPDKLKIFHKLIYPFYSEGKGENNQISYTTISAIYGKIFLGIFDFFLFL